jgi:hypothetical protein
MCRFSHLLGKPVKLPYGIIYRTFAKAALAATFKLARHQSCRDVTPDTVGCSHAKFYEIIDPALLGGICLY